MERIDVGGASMPKPCPDLEWTCRYGSSINLVDCRLQLASIVEAYNYLMTECTIKEAARRIGIVRKVTSKIRFKNFWRE